MLDLWSFLYPESVLAPVPSMPLGVSLAGAAKFLAVFTLPGLALVLAAPRMPRAFSYAVAAAFGVSAAWVVVTSLALLHFGVFTHDRLLQAAGLPLLVALVRAPAVVRNVRRLRVDGQCLGAGAGAAAFLAALVLTTPPYSSFSALGMDTANYELYSNHFARTGSLYLDLAPYAVRGFPDEWVVFRNNWALTGDGRGAPYYVYGFPALLAVSKTLFGSPYAGWPVNALLGILAAGMLGGLAARLSRSLWLGAGLGVLVGFSPVVFQYAKVAMSEMTALFGFLLVVLALLEQDRARSGANLLMLAAGWALVLFAKLDAFVLMAFFGVAVAYVVASGLARARRPLLGPAGLVAVAAALLVSGATAGMLTSPQYASHFSFAAYERLTSLPFAVPYSVAAAAGLCVLALAQRRLGDKPRSWLAWVHPVAAAGIAFAWYAFIAWNLSLRPFGHVLTDTPNDWHPVNLLRLFWVTPAVPLVGALVLLPWVWARGPRGFRIVLVLCGATLAMLVLKSRHSPSTLWWMRRYLVSAVPLLVLAPAFALGRMRRPRPATLWAGAFAGLVALQVVHMAPLLAQVNAFGPEPGEPRAEDVLTPGDSVVTLDGEPRVVTGMATVLRSMHDGLVLVNVPTPRLDDVAERLQTDPRALLLAADAVPLAAWRGLAPVHRGVYIYRLQGLLEETRKNPRAAYPVPYTLYDLGEAAGVPQTLFDALDPPGLAPGVRRNDLEAVETDSAGAAGLRATGRDPFLVFHRGRAPEGMRLAVHAKFSATEQTACRLFYRLPNMKRFDEPASLTASPSAGTASLYFLLPPDAAGPLRLDLGNEPGDFVLHALAVRAVPAPAEIPASAWAAVE